MHVSAPPWLGALQLGPGQHPSTLTALFSPDPGPGNGAGRHRARCSASDRWLNFAGVRGSILGRMWAPTLRQSTLHGPRTLRPEWRLDRLVRPVSTQLRSHNFRDRRRQAQRWMTRFRTKSTGSNATAFALRPGDSHASFSTPPDTGSVQTANQHATKPRETLAIHNMKQFNTLLVTKDGQADPKRWGEVRRRGSVRIYTECSSTLAQGPSTPQLLLLGTVEGKLEDIMYGVVATTDEAMKIKSACTHDGVQDSKVLCELLRPTFEAHSATLASSGGSTTPTATPYRSRQLELPGLQVCSLYRQKTSSTVECYVRGFFDLRTQDEMIGNLTLQGIAAHWAAFSRKSECALMKKLAWKMRKSYGWTPSSSRTYSFADDISDFKTPKMKGLQVGPRALISARCNACRKRSRFMHTCKLCDRLVCSKCYTRKRVCAVAPDKFSMLEKKRAFCADCMREVHNTSALSIAREEFLAERGDQEESCWNSTGGLFWSSGTSTCTLLMSGARQRASSISDY